MRKALIIGANSDIAFEFSKILAKNNYNLILASRNMVELKDKKKFFESYSKISCKIYYFDIEKFDTFKDFISSIDLDIDTILVSAGYLEKNEINFEKIENINFYGPKKIIEEIILNKDFQTIKHVIAISSIAADKKNISNNTYSFSKKRFSQFLKTFSNKKLNKTIIIKDIKPGYVSTKMTKNFQLIKFLISSPSFVAKKIFLSLDSNKREVYVPIYWKLIVTIYNLIPSVFLKK